MAGGGRQGGCPCTNATSVLASLPGRRCLLPGGDDGIQLTVGGSCVPFSYGSSRCLRHDLRRDPACRPEIADNGVAPDYCIRPWCYVDIAACRRGSDERVYRSDYFPHGSGVDLFYSYSVCNSTAEDWLAAEEDVVRSRALGGISIAATIPTYVKPMMYKRDPNNSWEILYTPGSEYYDDSIPYEGAYLSYIERIREVSNGDIKNITITHRSRASSLVHPASSFTAAVQDIQDGLVDMAIGPFWITGQRLRMASFTIPIVEDKTFLVIPEPSQKNTLISQAKQVLAPFSYELWGLVAGIIAVTSLLSVWFSDRPKGATRMRERRMMSRRRTMSRRRALSQSLRRLRRRKKAYARLALDSCIQKALFFCSAGVDQDEGGSLPNNLLMLGFGFFVLIIVSCYVANLAAFLTLSPTFTIIKNMEDAVKAGVTVCAHPVLKRELQVAWPEANFYFHEAGREFHGILDDYDKGKCEVMAVGWEDTGYDMAYLEKLCERKLVYTKSPLLQIPIAFPIRRQLESGLSYWILKGEKYHGASIKVAQEGFSEDISCNVHFSEQDERGKYDPILVKNMFLPLIFFLACVAISVLLQIIHQYRIKRGKESFAGRSSSMRLVASRAVTFNFSDVEDESDGGEECSGNKERGGDHRNTIEEGPRCLVGTSADLGPNSVSRRQHRSTSLTRRRSPDVESESDETTEEGGTA